MELLENSGGPRPGSDEGGNADMVENEHPQEFYQILEPNIFSMERQSERGPQDLVR